MKEVENKTVPSFQKSGKIEKFENKTAEELQL